MNEKIFHYLNNLALQNELFDTIVIFITDWLIWWMFFGVLLLFLFKKITLEQFLKIIFYPIIIWIIAKIIKYFYYSPRPFLELENIKLLIEHGGNDSIPSGHTVLSFALATITYLYHKNTGIIFIVLATLIGLSRIIIGVHWPLDVLAGFVFGILGILILKKSEKYHNFFK